MDEKELEEEKIEKRKKEIEEYRLEREKIFANLTEEEQVEFLTKMYSENENAISEMELKTISEDDVK